MTESSRRAAQANSFGAAAAEYERGRPPYPAAAIEWMLPAGARRVLDLGAGTGKLTRQLVERNLDVVAVEPSEGMRAELSRQLPGIRALAGTAEAIPLEDGSVDAVLVAQAWHWVDVARAAPEVARVLTPGGTLGLLWNIRDEREDWVARLWSLMRRGDEIDLNGERPDVGTAFAPIERADFEWSHHLDRSALLDLVASRSYVITMPAGERAVLLASVQRLMDTHPDLAGREDIALPYVTRCTRTTRA